MIQLSPLDSSTSDVPVYSGSEVLAFEPDPEMMLCDVELSFREVFFPLGFAFEIRTNDPAVLKAARKRWGGLRRLYDVPGLLLNVTVTREESQECPPTPTARGQRFLFSYIADVHNQMVCDLKTGFGFACLSQAAVRHNSYLYYYFLEGAALGMIVALYVTPVHAACVSRHGHGMLFCGESGAGKSTLAYACARAGWTYTTDDSSYLHRASHEPRIIGNSRQIRFRPPTRELFPELSSHGLTPRAEGKPSIEVPTAELPGLITSDEAMVHSVIVLNRQPSAVAELIPISRDAVFDKFSKNLSPVREVRELHVAALQALAAVDGYELRYCDLDSAIELLERLARGTPSPPDEGDNRA